MNLSKTKILFTLFLLITLITTISSAAYSDITMSVVEEPVCTINFGDNSTFTKQLISKDLNNKEVTLQLQVKNNRNQEKEFVDLCKFLFLIFIIKIRIS